MIAGPVNTCERCGYQLLPGREVWLELCTVTGKYSRPVAGRPLPYSQGLFAFGKRCAAEQLRQDHEADSV